MVRVVDDTDPICGMKGNIPAHGFMFCSEYCVKKFEKEHGLEPLDGKPDGGEEIQTCCSVKPKTPWYKEKFWIVTITAIALLVIAYFFEPMNPYYDAFIDYLALIWWAVLLGLLIGGIIEHFIPREYIMKYLSRHQKRTVFYAITFGFLMSACSHGILAIAIQLYKKGASTSSVVAFLLASPWANLPITFLLFSFFGWKALVITLSALVVAIITGLIFQSLEKRGMVECNQCAMGEDAAVLEDFSIRRDMKRRWLQYEWTRENNMAALKGTMEGAWALNKMVMWWLIIGMIMAAFARAYIPHELFVQYMGPTLLGLGVTLLFATIIEVCSEGSSVLAFEIYNQSGAFGNSFVFLMAGVATDYTEIGLIWHNIGKRAAIWIPIITVPQIIILGFLFNLFL